MSVVETLVEGITPEVFEELEENNYEELDQ